MEYEDERRSAERPDGVGQAPKPTGRPRADGADRPAVHPRAAVDDPHASSGSPEAAADSSSYPHAVETGRPDRAGNGGVAGPRARLLNARQTIEYLGISLSTLNRIEKRGLLVPFRTPGGHRRYAQSMLDEYLETTRKPPDPDQDAADD